MKTFPRIIFFGTPDFAVESLKSILDAGFSVPAVVTAPDKPAGRGLKQKFPPVKEFARIHDLPVLQPISLKDPIFLEQLTALNPDLQVVVAFRIMPEAVWSIPSLGTFNLHGSMLPEYRGAAPINRVIMNGEKETGVTTFFLDKTVDTGRIIFSERIPVLPDETAGELHDRMKVTGASLVVKTIKAITAGEAPRIVQSTLHDPAVPLKMAPRIMKEDCRIDWTKSAAEIYNFIRGLSPHPGAFTELDTPGGSVLRIKVFRSTAEYPDHPETTGKVITDGRTYIKVSCADGYIHLNSIQAPGRNQLEIRDFLMGNSKVFSISH